MSNIFEFSEGDKLVELVQELIENQKESQRLIQEQIDIALKQNEVLLRIVKEGRVNEPGSDFESEA